MSGLFRTLTWAVPLDPDALDSPRRPSFRPASPSWTLDCDRSIRRSASARYELEEARERAASASRRQLLRRRSVHRRLPRVRRARRVPDPPQCRRDPVQAPAAPRAPLADRPRDGWVCRCWSPCLPCWSGSGAGLLAGAVVADAAGRPAGDAVGRALTSAESGLGARAVGARHGRRSDRNDASHATLEIRGRGITPLTSRRLQSWPRSAPRSSLARPTR